MPNLFANKYRIKSTRLKGWDYSSAGYYFVTVCTKDRRCCLGRVIDGKMKLSPQGKIVEQCWCDLQNHYNNISLDEWVVMPNHVHGIVVVNIPYLVETGLNVETGLKPVSTNNTNKKTKRYSLSEIIRALKTFSARRINKIQQIPGRPFWQTRFYDHIIRNEQSLNRIRQYIRDNPKNWHRDRNNPKFTSESHGG